MISKNEKLIVLMPPKTASNSIKKTLEKHGVKFSTPTKRTTSPLIHLKLNEIVDLFEVDNLNDYKILQIVRDPYQRFFSSYFHQLKSINGNRDIKFFDYDLKKFTNHLYSSIKSENFLKNFYGDTFCVERSIRNGVSWGGSRLFDTQLSWKNLDCEITYLKLEEIKNDISPLSNLLGIEFQSLDMINKNSINKNYLDLIDDEIKIIIEDLFDEDFKSFQYLHI